MVIWQIRAISFFWQTYVISRRLVHHPFHLSELNLIKLRRGDEFKVKTMLVCHCLVIRWALEGCKWDTISIMSSNLLWILFFTVDNKETNSFFYDVRGTVILHLNVQNDQLVFCKRFEARHAFSCSCLIS